MQSRSLFAILCVLAANIAGCAAAGSSREVELAETRALFDANIRAIQEKNKESYLACYRDDEALLRVGPDGVKTGYAELAATTATSGSDGWPSALEASEVHVYWVEPGVVYGTYKYRVTIAGETTEGISERVFIKRGGRWQIGVSTAFPVAAKK
jgi:hypothetical protein